MFQSWETAGGTVHVARSRQARHVTVIGAGMVAHKFAGLMVAADPDVFITLVGDESAYDRTQLVHLVDGTRDAAALDLPALGGRVEFMPGRVMAVDPDANQVTVRRADGRDIQLGHDTLVFATGAEARRPDIPGMQHAHVFRRLGDVQALLASQPRRVVVIGGGVLGVELAHALRRRGCEVVLVHSGTHLMDRQLDEHSGRALADALYADGIGLRLATRVTAIEPGRVKTPENTMSCDAVVVVAGSVPNDELAAASGLVCENGIVVDDDLCSSHPNIHAIGDCVCHDGRPGGLVACGYEHAHIVTKCLNGQSRWAPRANPAVFLKTRHGLVSFGQLQGRALTWQGAGGLRKLWLDGGRVVGVVVIGACDELPRLREVVRSGARVAPWRRWLFRWGGQLWPEQHDAPDRWPAETEVCHCHAVTKAQVSACIAAGAGSLQAVGTACGAGTGCGGCQASVAQLLAQPAPAVPLHRWLAGLGGVCALAAVLLLSHPLPYPQSFQGEWGWLWRDHAMKQLSGYTLLLLAALLGAIGLRKRIARWQWGGYGLWRAAHAALGLLALAGTVLHSGGRVGQGIAGALSLSWMLALLAGAALALLSARAHVLPGLVQRRGREALHAVHVAALWGLPVLLGFHIAGAYLWH